MELLDLSCSRCGGDLLLVDDMYRCKYCGSRYVIEKAEEQIRTISSLFDEEKYNRIRNLRRILYDATTAPFISTTEVKNACAALKQEDPDDFRANFFDIAVGNNLPRLISAIRNIDTEEQYDDMPNILRFLIDSLNSKDEFLALNNLIERTYREKDLTLFEKYATMLSEQAEKVERGVYETKQTRHVFVAYSSKDMDKVEELVEALERNKLSCFVAARNLRHGKGAVENYNKALEEAMDHCRVFVFVSSMNSRSFSCDAWRIELEFIRNFDLANAPPEYRRDYSRIPQRYKKLRVQYMIEQSSFRNAADDFVNEIFDGYEWAYSADEVVSRVLRQLTENSTDTAVEDAGTMNCLETASTLQINLHQEITNALHRAAECLEKKQWDSANSFCERALKRDPENVQAYIYKLMVKLKISKEAELADYYATLDGFSEYQTVLRSGDDETVERLIGYNQAIINRLDKQANERVVEAEREREREFQRQQERDQSEFDRTQRECVQVVFTWPQSFVWCVGGLMLITVDQQQPPIELKNGQRICISLPVGSHHFSICAKGCKKGADFEYTINHPMNFICKPSSEAVKWGVLTSKPSVTVTQESMSY